MSEPQATTLAVGIDEIPTQPSATKASIACVAAILLSPLGYFAWRFGPRALAAIFEQNANVAILLQGNGLAGAITLCFSALGIVGAMCGICGLLGFVRSSATYHLLRAALLLVYPATAAFIVVVWLSVFSVVDANIEFNGGAQDRATALIFWWKACWPALAIALYAAWLHAMLRSRSVYTVYTQQFGPPMRGDQVLENVRTHGRDPRARRSLYGSLFTHILVLILIPWLLQQRGCVEGYRVPKGSGNPVVAMVKIVKPKKKKRETLTLRPNSAILFEIPDLDDTEVDRQMEEQTQNQYAANPNTSGGNLGGGGGKEGGWPNGMDGAPVRFIRLNHGGDGWDDGMNQTAADINFLRAFDQMTNRRFKVARKGESHSIALLAKYREDQFPPFVFLTGNRGMGRTTATDHRILRDYCLNGGMLIADAGSAEFDRSFRGFIRQVFPDKPLLDIADDDVLYQLPYTFPDGAPGFWHHGGRRALGLKHEGRWIVFYHPGDMNDAWKSPGYSDVTPEMRDAAMQLGVNLVRYSFESWNDAVGKLKK